MLSDLITRFHDALPALKRGAYNETEVRVQFINPLFEALGWDMDNRTGRGEVKHEDKIAIAGKAKAPDYGFYLDARRRFFVEAKKPAVNLAADTQPAFQLRRYAWTAKLPLSVLTDFEELAVYDTRVRPHVGDAPTVARLRYWRYDQYADQWADIAALFGRDAVLAGSLEQFAAAEGGKKGIATVDAEFLRQLNEWRDLLARAIANRNPGLAGRDLNFAVQQTLDRLIFLRIAEDRAIEPYGRLRDLTTGPGTFDQLLRYFYEADNKYNSGLFHFRHEKAGDAPDMVSPRLTIDDKPLKEIIRALYEPHSPYEFSVFPADILGQVYEQFLGQVIRLTSGGRAVVEEKPEVRKAGGVYYTPTYIVDYIVRQTVGRLLAGHTPDPAGPVARLRVLDPACGSGSFLLGAYQFLLDWHLAGYLKDTKKWSRKRGGTLYQTAAGDYVLTLAERRRILIDNLYGVDIDPQAVEVTKLSLLLKVLEGAAAQLGPQAALLGERVLPDLDGNVMCGNSLIGPDFYERRVTSDERRVKKAGGPAAGTGSYVQPSLLADDELLRVNAFDWRAEFRGIMANGGFDAVIGNPPYLRIQGLQEYYGNQIDYFQRNYQSAVKRFDLYILFLEKGFRLLRNGGLLGYICPHKFLHADFGSGIRGFLRDNTAIRLMISFGNNLVFSQAATYTCLTILAKGPRESFEYFEFADRPNGDLSEQLSLLTEDDYAIYNFDAFTDAPWVLTNSKAHVTLKKLSAHTTTLGDVLTEILVGVQSGIDSVHVMRFVADVAEDVIKLFSERAGSEIAIERGLVKPFLRGEDVHRYTAPIPTYYCIYPYEMVNGKTTIIEEAELKRRFPLGYSYLRTYRTELHEIRLRQKTNPKYWYSCHRSRDMNVFETERIITPEISLGGNMTIAPAGIYHNTVVYSLLPNQMRHENQLYWLAILNSKVLWWFLTNTGNCYALGKMDSKLRCSVQGLEFERRTIVQGRMQSLPVVEHFDVLEGGRPRLGAGNKGPVRDEFALQPGEEALLGRVVVGVAGPAHAGQRLGRVQEGGVVGAGILTAAVGMVDEAFGRTARAMRSA